MLNFKAKLEDEYKSSYESAYDLPLKKQFSNPKIYTAKGDLSKGWYVYFSYRDPVTGKLKRQTPFYGNVNTFKTKEERMLALSIYRTTIQKYLKKGYSPYGDNTEIHNAQFPSRTEKTILTDNHLQQVKEESIPEEVDMGMTILDAIEFDHAIKKKTLRDSSIRSYKSHINVFRAWLEGNHPDVKIMKAVDKKMAIEFLNHVLQDTSARNRNNYRASLSSLFQCLEDNEIVPFNFIGKIKVLNSAPKRNKTYSLEQQEEIFEYLKQTDPLMLLYIKFVSYNFLRPLEVCRLKVGDIDLKTKTLSFVAKNSPMKTKIIPDILLEELIFLLLNYREEHSKAGFDYIFKKYMEQLEGYIYICQWLVANAKTYIKDMTKDAKTAFELQYNTFMAHENELKAQFPVENRKLKPLDLESIQVKSTAQLAGMIGNNDLQKFVNTIPSQLKSATRKKDHIKKLKSELKSNADRLILENVFHLNLPKESI